MAARGGAWKPDLMLSLSTTCFMFIPYSNQLWILEMLLLLPTILYQLTFIDAWYMNIPRDKHITSSIQYDIVSYRQTNCISMLDELVSSGKRHQYDMSVCLAVSQTIHNLEKSNSNTPNINNSTSGYKGFTLDRVIEIEQALLNGTIISNTNTKSAPISITSNHSIQLGHDSYKEFLFLCLKCISCIVFICLGLYVLFTIELPEANINL